MIDLRGFTNEDLIWTAVWRGVAPFTAANVLEVRTSPALPGATLAVDPVAQDTRWVLPHGAKPGFYRVEVMVDGEVVDAGRLTLQPGITTL